MRSLTTIAFGCLFFTAAAATAQQPPALPSDPVVLLPASSTARPDALTAEQDQELARWVDDMTRWTHQEKHFPNEPVHNNYGKVVQRKGRPEPPAWLGPYCASLASWSMPPPTKRVDQGCHLFATLALDPDAEAIRQQTQAERADKEKVVKSSFMSRVHLDGLWTTTSSDLRYYGLVGSHISLVDVGRIQFFGPPGILVLRMPDGYGSHQIRVGYTWGMSIRLTDLKLLSPQKNMTLFLSITKCWTMGSDADRLRPGGFDIAGFSIAPRKPR